MGKIQALDSQGIRNLEADAEGVSDARGRRTGLPSRPSLVGGGPQKVPDPEGMHLAAEVLQQGPDGVPGSLSFRC